MKEMKAMTVNYRGKSENYPSEHLEEDVIVDIKVKMDKWEQCTGNVTYTDTNLTRAFTFTWFDEWGIGRLDALSDWSQVLVDGDWEHECVPLSDHIMNKVECFFNK